jgi:hypothetical protein
MGGEIVYPLLDMRELARYVYIKTQYMRKATKRGKNAITKNIHRQRL